MPSRTNEEWIGSLQAADNGRQDALADLQVCLHRAALFYLQRRGSGFLRPDQIAAVADDAAQEATLQVLEKLKSFCGDAAFLTWASKFGISAAAQLLRRRQWHDVSLDDTPTGWDGPVATLLATDAYGEPELAAQRKEVRDLLLEVARDDLTAKQRLAIHWILFQGIPFDEVAERLQISRGTPYKLGHDARRALKRGIERRGWTCADALEAFARPA